MWCKNYPEVTPSYFIFLFVCFSFQEFRAFLLPWIVTNIIQTKIYLVEDIYLLDMSSVSAEFF